MMGKENVTLDRVWRRVLAASSHTAIRKVLVALPVLAMAAVAPHKAQAGAAWGGAAALSWESNGAAVDQPPASVLNDSDVALYQKIFALQSQGRWDEADGQISQLGDRLLMGHVLYQRYTHAAWKSSWSELQSWLDNWHDQPGASTIFALASKRGGKGATSQLTFDTWNGALHHQPQPRDTTSLSHPEGRYSGKAQAIASRQWEQIRRAISDDAYETASRQLAAAEASGSLSHIDINRLKAALAQANFLDGNDAEALKWAGQAVYAAGDQVPVALWAGALAAWRQGDVGTARQWFNRLARANGVPPWMTAGGAYWSARAALRDRQPQDASQFLLRAAGQPRTFYGLLARRSLGLPSRFQWEASGLSVSEATALSRSRPGRRAMALVQVGQGDSAEQELRGLYPQADDQQRAAALRLADIGGMASFAMQLSSVRDNNGDSDGGAVSGVIDNARYPVPNWEPQGGWRLDRALIYALVRQESAFRPEARSWAGAHGLMQVMPATAAFISRQPGAPDVNSKSDLLSPELNLAFGQKYIEHLLEQPDINGNLLYAAAAYNAGPGNLKKWLRRGGDSQAAQVSANDPLMFVESIPLRETRLYVQRVMANMWIYQDRLGQGSPTLDRVAAGDWPRYVPVDHSSVAMLPARP